VSWLVEALMTDVREIIGDLRVTSERHAGPHDPAWCPEGVPPADPDRIAKELKDLPANTWAGRPRPNIDWGLDGLRAGAGLDRALLRRSLGLQRHRPAGVRREGRPLVDPVRPGVSLEYVYSNDQVHSKWSFGDNPWMTWHTDKATGYDLNLKASVFVPHEYSYFFDPLCANAEGAIPAKRRGLSERLGLRGSVRHPTQVSA
jgi:hypothetical protein